MAVFQGQTAFGTRSAKFEKTRRTPRFRSSAVQILVSQLDLLVNKFAGHVKATPRVVPSAREGTFDFESRLAKVRLKFAAFTDREVRKVTLSYDLEIIPVLMRFKPHDEIEFSLDAVDKEAVARWIDDRIVDFVQTYFSLNENEIYLKDQMVEDPIAHVRFPRVAAATTK